MGAFRRVGAALPSIGTRNSRDLHDDLPGLSTLPPRQWEVLQLLAEGNTMKEAGSALCLTPRTIAFHKYRIMGRLGIETGAELVKFAVKSGLIQL